jgi:hypothetical protein
MLQRHLVAAELKNVKGVVLDGCARWIYEENPNETPSDYRLFRRRKRRSIATVPGNRQQLGSAEGANAPAAEHHDLRHQPAHLVVSGEVTLGDIAAAYGVTADAEQSKLTLADYFDIHLDHAPKEGATLDLDSIVLVARSIGGGRVNVVGLRLPEDEEEAAPLTRMASLRRKLSEVWSSVAGV